MYDKKLTHLKEAWQKMTEQPAKLKPNEWYHGDSSKRTDNFCNQNMDRDQHQDKNAEGPGIYFTKDLRQARGYAYPDGYVYKVNIDPSKGHIITDDDEGKDNKKFLLKLLKKAQQHDPESVFYGVSNWLEVYEPEDVKDEHLVHLVNNYLANETLITACILIYNEFFGGSTSANAWAAAMKDLGVIGHIHQLPDTTHFIAYDCNAIDIIDEKKLVDADQ